MCTQKQEKDEEISKLKRKKKRSEMLLDSNPHLYPLGYRGILIFSFIKEIMPQSKAPILRRLPKIGRKVIEYSCLSRRQIMKE